MATFQTFDRDLKLATAGIAPEGSGTAPVLARTARATSRISTQANRWVLMTRSRQASHTNPRNGDEQ
jgi:hypothetical protein